MKHMVKMKEKRKGVWRMPRHLKAMKDVISCDKFEVGANSRRTQNFRMGQPYIFRKEGKPGELKHLSTRRKRKQ